MAEKIAGITMREIDQSQPTRTRPEGIPAGVLGTAAKGPAFVPVLFANTTDFVREFGSSRGGDYFGPIAVAEWMKNAKAGLYLRTLGVGNAEKADSTYGFTTNAGFIVGETMRDKDRLASGYPTLETDDDVDGLADNPYAGDEVPDALFADSAQAPARGTAPEGYVAPATETFTLVVNTDGDNANGAAFTPATVDGHYIVVEANNGVKNVLFLSSQVGRTIDGLLVKDGTYTVKNFTGIADSILPILDVSALTTNVEVANAIEGALHTIMGWSVVQGLNAGVDDHQLVFTASTDYAGAGGTGTLTGVTLANKSDTASTPLEVSGATPGVDEVTGAAAVLAAKFSNLYLPPAGSTIVISGHLSTVKIGVEFLASGTTIDTLTNEPDDTINTQESYIGIDLSSITLSNGDNVSVAVRDALTDAYNALSADRQNDFKDAAGTFVVAQGNFSSPDYAYVTATWDTPHTVVGEVAPAITIFDNSPSSPKGRMHFLGCNMFSSGKINSGTTDDHVQDYLDGAYLDQSGAGGFIPVLRGVLMMPNGVVPGLATSSATFAEASVPSSAWGEYEAGAKDEGENLGHLEGGVFQLILNGYTGDAPKVLKASFDPKSSIYFGKIFNTNPEDIQVKGHYLYAHYDIPAGLAIHTADATATNDNAFCYPGTHDRNDADWSSSGNYEPTYEDFREKFSHASSPWIYSQAMGNGPKKLFKIHALDAGEIAFQDQYKIEISNVHQPRKGEYGTFNLKLRKLDDLDSDKIEIESYSGLSLDPSSENFIGRKIGDQNTFFDFEKSSAKQKIVTEGLYPNKSRHIRVEIAPQVQSGQMEISALPVGFAGKNHLVIGTGSLEGALDVIEPPLPFRQRVSKSSGTNLQADSKLCWGLETMSVNDLTSQTRVTTYNATTEKNAGLIHNLCKFFPSLGTSPASVGDNRGAALVNTSQIVDSDRYNHNEFSLERLLVRCRDQDTAKTADPAWWHEARYIRNGNADFDTTETGQKYLESTSGLTKTDSNGYRYLNPAVDMVNPTNANLKYYKFVVPMQGGFNGLDIFDGDKKKMNNMSSVREMSKPSDYGATAGSTTAAFRKGLDILAEKADVDIQLLAIPGISSAGVTDHAIDKTEDRFDALYLMDIPAYDQDDKLFQGTDGTHVSVINTAKQLQDRNIDSSFAAAYFPNVNMMDPYNPAISVEAPPSCAVLGAMAFNDAVSHPWYAPAGFTRGTLTSVEEGTVIFDKDDLETLHVQDINPITSFANSAYDGMVVWGQKTMLQGKSALDRVNVRRLLIDIRRKVRVVANSILFEPNRESTLAAFSAQVNPILVRIQQQQGLDRFKVVIDSSTTTQQDIENNTIRGKIFLQPIKSIEFISLDFVVGNQID